LNLPKEEKETMKYLTVEMKKLGKRLFIALCLAISSFSSLAALPKLDTGPKVGSKLSEITALNQFGDKQQLNNFIASKGAIIVIYRSADWCPFCKKHLLELEPEVNKFKSLGYGVVGISYDSPKILRNFSQKNKLSFSLISDQNVETFKAWNVVNTDNSPGDRHYGIPFPGVIVVDDSGTVVYKYFFEGYKKRVKFKKLLNDLKAL
jgi:peroxiredoxin